MEKLPTIFNDFWNFIIPPIIELIILIGILYYFSNKKSLKNRLLIFIEKIRRNHPIFIEKILNPLGIKSLVSITCIIIVIVSIVSFHRITHTIGRNIPGNLSYSTDYALLAFSSHRDLAEIWRLYPEIEPKIEKLHFITMTIDKVLYENWNDFSELTTRFSSIDKKHGRILLNREFLKFLLVYLIFVPLILKKLKIKTNIGTKKILIAYVILLLFIVNNFNNQRNLIKNINFTKTYTVRIILSEKIVSKAKVEDYDYEYEYKLQKLQNEGKERIKYIIRLTK